VGSNSSLDDSWERVREWSLQKSFHWNSALPILDNDLAIFTIACSKSLIPWDIIDSTKYLNLVHIDGVVPIIRLNPRNYHSSVRCIKWGSWWNQFIWDCASLNREYRGERSIPPLILGSYLELVEVSRDYTVSYNVWCCKRVGRGSNQVVPELAKCTSIPLYIVVDNVTITVVRCEVDITP